MKAKTQWMASSCQDTDGRKAVVQVHLSEGLEARGKTLGTIVKHSVTAMSIPSEYENSE